MTAVYSQIFRASLNAFPHEFRQRFGDEIRMVFEERCRDVSPLARPMFVINEVSATVIAGVRLRLFGQSRQQALKATVVIAMLATTLTMRGASPQPAYRFEFNGHDPAGTFTISVVNGKAIAATLNRTPVSRANIVQKADKITIIGERGEVALAVTFDKSGQIAWDARR